MALWHWYVLMMMESFILDLVVLPNINATMPLQHLNFQLKCYYESVMNSKYMWYMLFMCSNLTTCQFFYFFAIVMIDSQKLLSLQNLTNAAFKKTSWPFFIFIVTKKRVHLHTSSCLQTWFQSLTLAHQKFINPIVPKFN